MLLQVPLVIVFGAEERGRGKNLRGDGPREPRLSADFACLRDGALRIVRGEDGRAVLRPDVGALPVDLRGVVHGVFDRARKPAVA